MSIKYLVLSIKVLIISAIMFYFLSQKKEWCLWLLLPLSIFFDLWRGDSPGTSGLKILAILIIIWLVFGPKVENYRLKI